MYIYVHMWEGQIGTISAFVWPPACVVYVCVSCNIMFKRTNCNY